MYFIRFLLGSAREEWEAAPEVQDKIQIRNESECKVSKGTSCS